VTWEVKYVDSYPSTFFGLSCPVSQELATVLLCAVALRDFEDECTMSASQWEPCLFDV